MKKKKIIVVVMLLVLIVAGLWLLPFIKPLKIEGRDFTYQIYGTYAIISYYKGEEEVVEIPSHVWFRKVKVIDRFGKEGAETVKKVIIPDTVEKIMAHAFMDYNVLTEIEIPDNVKEIGSLAFEGCKSLKKVKLPEGLKKIELKTFGYCSSLEEVQIPASVEEVEWGAFIETPWYENNTEEFLIVGDGVLIRYIGDDTLVEIPNSVKCVGEMVFYKNQRLETIIYPESVTKLISSQVFECPNLKYLIYNNPDVEGDYIGGDNRATTIIIAPKGSKPEKFAKELGYKYAESIPEE